MRPRTLVREISFLCAVALLFFLLIVLADNLPFFPLRP